jgi:hypothetical protein
MIVLDRTRLTGRLLTIDRVYNAFFYRAFMMMFIVYDGTSLSNGVFQRLSLVLGKIFRLFQAGPSLYAD